MDFATISKLGQFWDIDRDSLCKLLFWASAKETKHIYIYIYFLRLSISSLLVWGIDQDLFFCFSGLGTRLWPQNPTAFRPRVGSAPRRRRHGAADLHAGRGLDQIVESPQGVDVCSAIAKKKKTYTQLIRAI